MMTFGRYLNGWVTYRLWRLKRWNAKQNCIAHHRHVVVENEVESRKTGTLVKAAFCRACSHVSWVD